MSNTRVTKLQKGFNFKAFKSLILKFSITLNFVNLSTLQNSVSFLNQKSENGHLNVHDFQKKGAFGQLTYTHYENVLFYIN